MRDEMGIDFEKSRAENIKRIERSIRFSENTLHGSMGALVVSLGALAATIAGVHQSIDLAYIAPTILPGLLTASAVSLSAATLSDVAMDYYSEKKISEIRRFE